VEGRVAARLFVDGYRGYSDPALTNQWQQIRFSYTPTSSKTINVGLRFYDRAGFDGSEVLYIDGFKPSAAVPIPPTPVGCSATESRLILNTDNYGSETTWQLRTVSGQVLGGGSNLANNRRYTKTFCLNDGDYTFIINDSYGDGICCRFGNGSYRIEANGTELISGGEFGRSETKTFSIRTNGGGSGDGNDDYYLAADGLNGLALKTALHNIIKGHAAQGYSALWGFYAANELDVYYENDGSVLDIYSENPTANDAYSYSIISDQCGNFNSESDCYNREHSFPRS